MISPQDVGWSPYPQPSATYLSILLLLITIALSYFSGSRRLVGGLQVKRPGRTIMILMSIIWFISLITLVAFYSIVSYLSPKKSVFPPSPIAPVTYSCAAFTFAIILYMTRHHGFKLSLTSAFVGTAAAPMIFELPFDIIISPRGSSPLVVSLLVLSPLFLVEFTTLSLLFLSSLVRVSKWTFLVLASMFLVFSVWALFGFHILLTRSRSPLTLFPRYFALLQ